MAESKGSVKKNLLVAATVASTFISLSATMPMNVAYAADLNRLKIGNYNVEAGKIYYGTERRSALIDNYLSSQDIIVIDEQIQWKLPAEGGVVQYKSWIPEHTEYNSNNEPYVVSAHWEDNWHDSVYHHAFRDSEHNIIAESISNPGYFYRFDRSFTDSNGVKSYAEDAIATFGSRDTQIKNLSFLGNLDFNVTITERNFNNIDPVDENNLGLTVNTSVPRIHNYDDGNYRYSSGPYDMTITGNINKNTMAGAGTLLNLGLGYSHYDSNTGTQYDKPTTVNVNNLNVNENVQNLTNTLSGGGGLIIAGGNYTDTLKDTLNFSNLSLNYNTANANTALNSSPAMGSFINLSVKTNIEDSSIDNNKFQSQGVKHGGSDTIRIYGVGLSSDKEVNVKNSTIRENKVYIEGSDFDHQQGIQIMGVNASVAGNATFNNVKLNAANVSVNYANGSAVGLGLNAGSGIVSVIDSEIKNNTAIMANGEYYARGIGVYSGGADINISDSTIQGNLAAMGGTINNAGDSYDIQGVGLYARDGRVFLKDTLVENNSASYDNTASNNDYVLITMQGGGIYRNGITGNTNNDNVLILSNSSSGDEFVVDGNTLLVGDTVLTRTERLHGGGIFSEWGHLVIDGSANSSISISDNKLTANGVLHSEDGGDLNLLGGGIYAYGGFSGNYVQDMPIHNAIISNNQVYGLLFDDDTTVYAYDDRTESTVSGGGIWSYQMNSDIENVDISQNSLTTEVYLNDTAGFGTLRSYGGGAMLQGGINTPNVTYTGDMIKGNSSIIGNVINFTLGASNQGRNVGFNYRAIDIGGGGLYTASQGQFGINGTSNNPIIITANRINFTNASSKKYSPVYLVGGGIDALSGGTYQNGSQSFVINNAEITGNEINATSTKHAGLNSWGSLDDGTIYALGGGIALDGNDDSQGAILDPTFINTTIQENIINVSAVDDRVYARGGGMYLYMPGYNQNHSTNGIDFDRTATLTNVDITDNEISVESNDGAYASGGGIYINTHYGQNKIVNIDGQNTASIKHNTINTTAIQTVAGEASSSAEGYGGGLYFYNDDGNDGKNYNRSLSIKDVAEISSNNVFASAEYDKARAGAFGGGLYIQKVKNESADTKFTLENTPILGNQVIATAKTAPIHHSENYTDPSTGQTEHYEWTENFSEAAGGGLHIWNSKAQILNSDIMYNSAKSVAAGAETEYSYGGGIYSKNSDLFLMKEGQVNNKMQIKGNKAAYGGGLYMYNTSSDLSNSSAYIVNANFEDNTATKNGGSIYADYSTLTIYDTNFLGNKAVNGGAIYADHSTINIYNDIDKNVMSFSENTATGKGSDIYLNHSTLNLYPGVDGVSNGIIFYGTIAGDADSVINQYNETGVIALSGTGQDYKGTYNLHSGDLTFLNNDNKATNYRFTTFGSGNGSLTLQNYLSDKTYINDVVTIDKMTTLESQGNQGIKLLVDFDASDSHSMDKITVNSVGSTTDTPGVYLKAINITKDGYISTATYLDGAARNNVRVRDDEIIATTEDFTYTFTPDLNTHGLLHIIREANPNPLTLAEAIQDEGNKNLTSYSFTKAGDYVNYDERGLGDLYYKDDMTRDFTIFGNGHDLDGNELDGVFTQAGQVLTVNNVPNVKNFGGAAIYVQPGIDDELNNIHLADGVANIVNTSFKGNTNDILNSGVVNLQSGNISFEKGIKDCAESSDSGVTNINGATVVLVDNAVIWQNALNINSGSLTAKAQNLEGTITNAGTLNLTGSLDKAILGEGTTNVNNNLILTYNPETYSQALIEGTLNLNNGTLDASGDNVINGFSIGTLTGNGNFSIDARIEELFADVDCLNIENNAPTGGTLTVNAINLLVDGQTADNVRDFEATVLYGGNTNLAISQELANTYNKTTKEQQTDEITANVSWTDTFGTKERTITRVLSAVKSEFGNVVDTLKLATTKSEWQEVGTKGDTLNLINTSDAFIEKSFNFDSATDVYTSSNDAGTTVGTLSINGFSVGDDLSTIDLNGKSGFTLGEGSTLNISNVKLTGNNTVITNNGGTLAFSNTNTIEGALTGTGTASNSGTLNITADNLGNALANTGTLNLGEGTLSKVISGTGAVNITGDVVNNAANTMTGAVNVAAGKTLSLGSATNDLFASASTITVNDGTTLNLQNGNVVTSETATAINNLVIADGAKVNVMTKWNDKINGALAGTTGGITVTSVDVKGTNGVVGTTDSYIMSTTLANSIALSNDLTLANAGSTTYNSLTYNSTTGSLSATKSKLVDAIQNTDVGERAAYAMTENETAGGQILEGVLKIQGNGNTIQSDATATASDAIQVGNGTAAGADLIMEDVNLGAIKTNGAEGAIVVKGGNQLEYKAATGNVSINGSDNGTGIYLQKDDTLGAATVTLNAEGGEINISDDIRSSSVDNVINFQGAKEINFSGTFDPATANINTTVNRSGAVYDEAITYNINAGGTLKYTNDSILWDPAHHTAPLMNTINFNGGALDTRNGVVTDFNLTNMSLTGTSSFYGDVDLANGTMDKFTITNAVTGGGTLNVAGFNLISDAPTVNTSINFTNDATLMNAVNYTGAQGLTALSPIYKYNVGYDNTNGNFDFTRYNSGGYGDFNPSVLAGSVAAQMGGYLTQLQSYDEAFYNMDMYMLMTKEQRTALKFKNQYAAADSGLLYDSSLARQERAEGWFRPYATFEKVGLRRGPKVENTAYGTYMGGESKMYDLGHGWDGMFGAYVGYNGSHQNYNGVSIYQNGGTLGLTGMAYKGNFFTGLTINAGASVAEASTMYGNEDLTMLMAGIASKTGYNFELADGKFIIQPSMLMSYSFVNTFDYTNAAGVRIDSDPLHAIQLQPELKFIGNLKNGWQPYASVAMVWNIMDDTKFKANDVALPEMSVKPYVKYGLGVRKTWGERLTGFFQTYLTNGGRNGVGLQAGFTWALGKDPSKTSDAKLNKTPELKKTQMNLSSSKIK
ncbi:hypothetical protein IJG72_07980 [bacterium]|nr:hypothetical protein [bacterium]